MNKIKLARAIVSSADDHKRMVALGKFKNPKHVIRADLPEGQFSRWKMVKGEYLGLFDMRAFGVGHNQWLAGVAHVLKQGAMLVEVRPDGSLGPVCSSLSTSEFWARTLASKMGDDKGFTPDRAKDMAAKTRAARTAGRMPEDEARAIWLNPKWSEVERLDKINKGFERKWSRSSAHRHLKSTQQK